MPKSIRTFIAIELSAEIRRSAVELQRALAKTEESVNWVAPENIHLTLRFLGNVPDLEVPAVCKVARSVTAGAEPFVIDVERPGAFPNPARPRTLWLGVSTGAEAVVALSSALEEGLSPLGYRREKRRFHPHVTIGRVRGQAPGIAEHIEQKQDWSCGSMPVEQIVVMGSELTSGGPRYNVMGRAPLGGAPRT